jgi:hypothetical protein
MWLPTDSAGLLGIDFLEKTGAVVDFQRGKLSLAGIGSVTQLLSVPPTRHTALTVFAETKASRSLQVNKKEVRNTHEQISNGPHTEVITKQNDSWLVKSMENITVAPRCRQIILVRLESEMEQSTFVSLYRTSSDSY